MPTVTVLVPTWNREHLLPEAIASILVQTRPVDEIIVVDDGSTDGTVDMIARNFPDIRLLRQPHRGIGAARNTALAAATGDWISFLDSDDLWHPRKTEWQFAALGHNPDLSLIFGRYEEFQDFPEGRKIRRTGLDGWSTGTALIRRDLFTTTGDFRTDLLSGEFIDWAGRSRETGAKIHVIPEVVMSRRIHGGNTVNLKEKTFQDYAQILREKLQRERSKSKAEGPTS